MGHVTSKFIFGPNFVEKWHYRGGTM